MSSEREKNMKVFKSILSVGWKVVAILLGVIIIVGAIFAVRGYMLYSDVVKDTPISAKVDEIKSKQNYTEYSDLPQFYIDAVISVEDHRFKEHFGIDFVAICRAAWNDIKSMSFVEGGSTITQQLAKNMYYTQEKKIERKVAEMFTAFALEHNYSKQEIFELYVNTIYFGSGYYGIYDAAMGYFRKVPSQLSDYECAMLAGLPNAPSNYSPKTDPELANQRLKQVLKRMVECDKINQAQADAILFG